MNKEKISMYENTIKVLQREIAWRMETIVDYQKQVEVLKNE